jgi:hypothetical protein
MTPLTKEVTAALARKFFAFAMLACARLGYNRLPCTAEAQARSP